ncbi:chemotaxis protein CheB [Cupriavidus plantarum]|uniref:protein-glutamate methylesterase n=2 Tax=Cupriavidus plantarum TaxID=942865 RepID=A0A316EJD4_9BURK|nr:chemotaxis protein CheB [Cupriavidus plantarum]NYI01277.1 two-component system chemotaxis response regulator CheB [Cupriavidus plantarum]PWK31271.1 two-component system chemotaxis response regulator CheB [Cupriavidus plantarum]RLK39543.1 two-component system chemotaxis response regulator CheB [Cupriavidus plantarum]
MSARPSPPPVQPSSNGKPTTMPRRRPAAIVIGASAGGIEALNVLLPQLPADFAPPVIVVMHLRPDTPSLLPEVFGERCALPVREAEDKMPVLPRHIYTAPSDYHLLVERDGLIGPGEGASFSLSVEPPVRYSRPSIDVLFESAAVAWRDGVLGILLSGANDDGARGLHAIRAGGGMTWVQSPASAAVATMPEHAIARGAADRILPLADIGEALRREFSE